MPIHDWTRVEAGLFHHFHQRWIAALCDAFNAGRLPPGYFALAEQVAGGSIPDVLTLQRPALNPRPGGAGGAPVATAPPQARFVQRAESQAYARRANRVAIRHPLGHVVAVIEIVSPGNKDSRHSLRAFVDKAVGLLDQGVHLLVVDLFPPTKRDPQGIHKAIWDEIKEEPFELPPDKPLTVATYSAGPVKMAYVEPVAVGDMLPEMALFLEPEAHVPAPLETTYQTTWDVCPEALKEAVTGPPDGA
jgi:Protein of unknown function (DUF4058)